MLEIEDQKDDVCFLCGVTLDAKSRSVEHVFPKWLLRKGNLFNETLFQSNASTLPYRQCTIPCCVLCNSGPLSKLETEIRNAFGGGPEGVRNLEAERLSLWMAKIYYGTILRSNLLPTDRANPSGGPIVPDEVMPILSMLRFFLQRIRIDHQFNFDPDSTFVTNVHRYDKPDRDFDWMAATVIGKPGRERFVPALALRHNGVGVITLFGDGGAHKKLCASAFDEFTDVQLHPVQFVELACHAFYKHSLFTDSIGYCTSHVQGGPMITIAHIPASGPTWNQWDTEEYAMCLFRQLSARPHLGVSDFSNVFFGNGKVITFLHWPDGSRRVATRDELQ